MFNKMTAVALATTFLLSTQALADKYIIDTKGSHAFIQFRIQHLGYSWLTGRFNTFSGSFEYDEKNPANASVVVEIDTASVDSNHAERDKHLRDDDFLDVEKYPTAKFVSTSFKEKGDGTAVLEGNLTLHGVTKPVTIDVEHVGHGEDPWGGYRRGFEGRTRIALADFGINYNLGPKSKELELMLSVEGVRQ
ncbi:MAG: YceI family protein [Gammaproteobacteria bacterium]|nr:YceI family protein [Gammaproteobacteria bacterium]NNJ96899.1 YceI family protein [Gammaproteobacteria bacterium]